MANDPAANAIGGDFYDAHCHFFSLPHIPKNDVFQALLDQHGAERLAEELREHYANQGLALFVSTAARSTRELFLALQNHYQQAFAGTSWRFVPHMVDLSTFVDAGPGAPRTLYEDQLEALLRLKLEFPSQVFPFIAVDPRNIGIRRDICDQQGNVLIARGTSITDVVKNHVGKDRWLHGVKVYPTFGFEIFDSALDEVFEYCQGAQAPVTMHCARDGAQAATAVLMLKDMGRLPAHLLRWSDAANPDRVVHVLEKFPRLRIDLAHFGGEQQLQQFIDTRGHSGGAIRDNWVYKIINLLRHIEYPNVYTDISACVFSGQRYRQNLATIFADFAEIKHKILYGSDFYMSTLHSNNLFVFDDLRRALYYNAPGDNPPLSGDDIRRLAQDNARRFLF